MVVHHGNAGDLVARLPAKLSRIERYFRDRKRDHVQHFGYGGGYFVTKAKVCRAAKDCIEAQQAEIERLRGQNMGTWKAAALKAEQRAETAERVVEAARWNLPLAKGYAAAHRVGRNAEYVAAFEERLTAYDKESST